MTHIFTNPVVFLSLNSFPLLCGREKENKENTARRLSAERRRETVGIFG